MNENNNQKSTFKPFIPADKVLPEITPISVVLGLILSIVFGAANAYLGLRVGMTVSASIPAAVLSMGIIRLILKRDSILENNMVQTIGSAGESLAAGAIFTLPALFMWASESDKITEPTLITVSLIAFCGGILGVFFMIPLRTALIVEEHGVLPFPEGQACAEVLLAGEEGGEKSKIVFSGLGISALYKFIADGLALFPSEIHWEIPALRTGFGADVLPALAGVGYICGSQISSYMFAGGILGWFVLIPLISLFGLDNVIAPNSDPISALDSFSIWSSYIRYIGAGAVAAGGIISLLKSLPIIVKTFRKAIAGFGHKESEIVRTNNDFPMAFAGLGVLVVTLLIWIMPQIPVSFIGALIIVVFGFFFATVSGRMVGLVGSSNNPVSGMAIATLLLATAILKATGNTGYAGMTSAICIGTIICIIAAMAGDMSQDLKTGYLVGATPRNQQIGEMIGSVSAAIAIGGIMYLLHKAWGYGSAQLPAPQATLMKLVVPILPVAIGLYLPIHLSVPIFAGGLIRWAIDKKNKTSDSTDNGVLFSSGLIAGEGLVGILLAVFAIIPMGSGSLGEAINMGGMLGNIGGVIFFVALLAILIRYALKKSK